MIEDGSSDLQLFEQAIDAHLDTFFLFEPATGKALKWNQAFREVSGYADKEIAELKALESYYSSADLKRARDFIPYVLEAGSGTIDLELICKDGRRVLTEYVVSVVPDDNGAPRYLISIGRDITAYNRAQEKVKYERDRAQNYLDIAGVILVAIDKEQKVTLINRQGCEVLGRQESDILGQNWFDSFIPPAERENVKQVFQKIMVGDLEPVREFQNTILDGEGQERLIAWKNTAIRDEQGNIVETLSSGEDITEIKVAANTILKNEQLLSRAQEMGQIGTWDLDIINNVLTWTDQTYRIFGVPLGKKLDYETFLECVHPEDRDYVDKAWTTHVLTNDYDIEHRLIVDGKVKWVREKAEVEFDDKGQPTHAIGFTQDITEMKKAQQALFDSENRYRSVSELTSDFAYAFKVDDYGKLENEWVTEAFTKVTGYTVAELVAQGGWTTLIHPEDHSIPEGQFQELLDNRACTVEYRMVAKNGDIRWVRDLGRPHFDASKGRVVRVEGAIQDVTEQKMAEMALRDSEERHRTLYETMEQGVVYQNQRGEIIHANPAAERILGVTLSQMQGRTSIDPRWRAVHPDGSDFPGETHPAMVSLSSGLVQKNVPMGVFHPEKGAINWIKITSTPLFDEETEKPVAVYSIFEDITARKQAEDALEVSEEQLRSFFDNSIMGIYRTTPQGKIITANPAFLDMLGYSSLEEIQERNLKDNGYEPGYERRIFKDKMETDGHVIGLEGSWVRKDGSVIFVRENAISRLNEAGELIYYEGSVEDITDRKRAEEQLSIFKNFAEASSMAYGFANMDGSIVYVNPALAKIMGYDNVQEPLGTIVSEYYPGKFSETLINEVLPEVHKKGSWSGELPLLSLDGKVTPALQNITLLRDENGQPLYLGNIITDISERMLTEQALAESEARMQSIFRVAPIGIGIVVDRNIVQVNDQVCEMTGYSRKELEGQSARLLYYTQEEYEFVGEEKYRQVREFGTGSVETKWRTKEGEIRNILLSSTPLDSDDHSKGVTFTAMDITNRIQAELALKASLQTSDDIVSSSPIGLFIYDHLKDDRLILVSGNPAAEELTGLEVKEWIGKEFNDIWPKAKAIGFTDDLLNVIRTGKLYEAEELIYEDEKIEGAFRIRAFRIPGPRLVVAFENITVRKVMEDALRKSEERLRTVIDHSSEVYYIHDNDHQITYVSPQSLEIMGYSPEEMKIKWTSLITNHPMNEKGYELTMKAIETGERQKPYPLEVRHKDGNLRFVEIDESPILDAKDEVVGMAGAVRDITDRKKAEDNLKESERNYRTIFNSTSDMIFIHDAKTGKILDVNQRTVDTFGYPADFWKQAKVSDFSADPTTSSQSQILKLIHLAVKQGPQIFNWHVQDSQGKHFWVEVNLQHTLIGGEERVIAAVRDISDRKQAEDLLKESEERYRSLVEKAPTGIISIDVEGKVTDINPKLVKLLGYDSVEEILGVDIHDFPGLLENDFVISAEQAIRDEKDHTGEFRYTSTKGKELHAHVYLTPMYTKKGKVKGIQGNVVDITEHKAAEEALVQSESRFRALFETSPDGVIIVRHNKLSYANPAFKNIFDISDMKRYQDQPTANFIAPQDRARVEGYGRARESGDAVDTTYEFTGLTEPGAQIPVEVTAARFELDGEPALMAILRDISERKELESKLLQSERLAVIGQLAAGVAHEINTPLSNISLMADNLSEEIEDPEVKDYAQKTLDQVEFAAQIVRELLQFARPSSVELMAVDIHDIIERSLNQFQIPANVKITRRVGKGPMRMKGDPFQLQELLNNIISNSLDAMGETKSPKLEFRTQRDRDRLLLSISDNGAGILDEDIPHLLEPFFSTKPTGRGTGLGLALVQRYLQAHDGTIEVHSTPGKGTTIELKFPIDKDNEVEV